MFLSLLHIDVGENPDRPRPGRLWLRNIYHVHQRLCMAFPSAARKSDDPDFLKPFNPADFGTNEPKQVHVKRCTDAGFLFRIDPQAGGRVAILVQSAARPDWDYAFHNAEYFLAAPPQVKPFEPCFVEGQELRFRLVANPTRKKTTNQSDGRRKGKRFSLPPEEFYQWLDGKCQRPGKNAKPTGFSLVENSVVIQPGYVYATLTEKKDADNDDKERGTQARKSNGKRLRSVRYDGVLKITDLVRFQETLAQGIGPGKAFGFGLLSLARIPP